MPTHVLVGAKREPPRAIYTPSDALLRAAGQFAPRIARLWARPHEPYFAAEGARRHLIHLVVHHVGEGAEALAAAAEPLAYWSVRRVLAAYLPEAPIGLAEALRRLTTTDVWTAEDYARLQALLGAGGDGAKVLRHLERIDPLILEVVAALPEPLRRMRIVTLTAWPDQARLLRRGVAWGFGANADGRTLSALADRLERAGSPEAMFLKLLESFPMERFANGPAPGTDWFRPIVGPKAMRAAALRFRNCLAFRIPAALSGAAAYYEVVGPEPAIVEIVRNRATKSWVFGEIRGHANGDISPELMERIVEHLRAHGTRAPAMVETVVAELAEMAGW